MTKKEAQELTKEIRELKDEVRKLREQQWMQMPRPYPVYVPYVPYYQPTYPYWTTITVGGTQPSNGDAIWYNGQNVTAGGIGGSYTIANVQS